MTNKTGHEAQCLVDSIYGGLLQKLIERLALFCSLYFIYICEEKTIRLHLGGYTRADGALPGKGRGDRPGMGGLTSLAMVVMKAGGLAVAMRERAWRAERAESAAGLRGRPIVMLSRRRRKKTLKKNKTERIRHRFNMSPPSMGSLRWVQNNGLPAMRDNLGLGWPTDNERSTIKRGNWTDGQTAFKIEKRKKKNAR